VKLRKVLSYLFKTASRQEALKFQGLFEGSLMKIELARLAFLPVVDARGVILASWAMDLVVSVVKLFETARSVAQLEFAGIPQCSLSAERALRREFGELPSEAKCGFARALAVSLNMLLSGGDSKGAEAVSFGAIKREAVLESIVALQKVSYRCAISMQCFSSHLFFLRRSLWMKSSSPTSSQHTKPSWPSGCCTGTILESSKSRLC
jgi:hypothetical protein